MNLIFYDSILGNQLSNVKLKFITGDSESDYINNLKTQPLDWYYRTHEIEYFSNNLGHRSKNTNDINFENYVLFTGCSHTYGLGLELEKTYAYKVAKHLDVDYYNLGLCSTGWDVLFYNLLSWCNKFPKPKHVFIQCPEEVRFIRKNSMKLPSYVSEGTWVQSEQICNFIVAGDLLNYWQTRADLYYRLIKQYLVIHNIKITFISFLSNKFTIPEPVIDVDVLDYTRDLYHYGIMSNDNLCGKILKTLSK